MKHVIGIGLLVSVAFLLKWWIHSTIFLTTGSTRVVNGVYSELRVARGASLNVVIFVALLALSAVWGLVATLLFVLSHRRPI